MDHPRFVALQYWDHELGDWVEGHSGINLMDPAAYVKKLAARGTLARAVDNNTGETVYSDGGDLL